MAEPSTRTVERALTLVVAVCDRGHASLADAARDVGLPASTALRLLRTLEASGFLSRTQDGEYCAGSLLIQIGAQVFNNDMLVTLCRQPMRDLVEATGESVYLSIEGRKESAVYISIVEGTHSVRHTNWVGRTIPLERSAAGKVLRDDLPSSGYVIMENSVEDDVTAISAPVRSGGRVVAALSVIVPTYRMDHRKGAHYGQLLINATGRISSRFGDKASSEV